MHLSKGFLLVIAVVLLVLSILFVLPFLQYFLLAVLLAYLLEPAQERLESVTRPWVAALALTVVAAVALLLPIIVIARAVAADAAALSQRIQEGEIDAAGIERSIEEVIGVTVDIGDLGQSAVAEVQSGALNNVIDLFGTVTHMLIGLGLTLFLLYYFLKDRYRFLRWLRSRVPLSDDIVDDFFEEIDGIMEAVLAGHVFVAFVQGIVAGIGLFITGVPNALFWTAVMVVLSLLPIIGSFLVWGPAAVYLFAMGQPVAAAFLVVYGTIVVGISDDYLRPIVVDRYANLNPAVIIIGVFGGIYVIGFMGIFFGPVVIGMLRATLDVYSREYGPGEME